ncbi:hypothetical protein BSFP_049260 [Burkholderia stabilis]|uniref:Uncharacterized protein n=1 Tax=Burkholderia stabilis TaxID=95485 RepID=A0A1Y1BUW3_9BURK|nr:hypothetical protein BSFP_049260 [Burkholderia stabilis]
MDDDFSPAEYFLLRHTVAIGNDDRLFVASRDRAE